MREKIVMIESKWLKGQNSNNLTVQLDEPLVNVSGVKIIYAGLPCTFHNISTERGNNRFIVRRQLSDKVWGNYNVILPDGYYTIKTFIEEFRTQMQIMELGRTSLLFSLNESNGKLTINFKKRDKLRYGFTVMPENNDLLGFNVREGDFLDLPRRLRNKQGVITDEDTSMGDKAVNFRPFDYFHVHCDIIGQDDVLYNSSRSDLLVRIPLKDCDFGSRLIHYLTGLRERPCSASFNKFRINITDEYNRPVEFNGGDVQLELLFLINE